MENQISCDNCDCLENESELIETFDNQLLCSPCYIKKEFEYWCCNCRDITSTEIKESEE